MRANLIGGKLIEPTSVESGQHRLAQLDHELGEMEVDIQSPDLNPAKIARIKGCMGWLKTERRLLECWLTKAVEGRLPPSPVAEETFESFWAE